MRRLTQLLPAMPLLLVSGIALVMSLASFFDWHPFKLVFTVGFISSGVLTIIAMFRQTGRLFLLQLLLTVVLGLILLIVRIGQDWAHGFRN